MHHLLQINSSLWGEAGQSSQLANQFVAQWRERHPKTQIVVRDLATEPIPHLDATRFQAFLAKPEQRTAEQAAIVAESDALIAQIVQADVLVFGLPLYNFGIPSTLKTYFDHIARAGITFRYTDTGPQGLLVGKKAYVFSARGGLHANTPRESQTPYMQTFLNFLGIDDIEFVFAEGLSMGEHHKQNALEHARQRLGELAL